MDKPEYALNLICDRCQHMYGSHFSTNSGVMEGCAGGLAGCCPCAGFEPTKEEQDRINMRNMLEETSKILRDVMVGIPAAESAYTRLSVALELVRDTKGMLTS